MEGGSKCQVAFRFLGGERFVAVLEIPPVESAVAAVRVQIVNDVKAEKK
jgi:hypothetical protein